MSKVNTVLGPIPAEELGFVAVHEHIGYGMPGCELDTKWWKSPEQRYEETVPKLREFHRYGGGTFVDVTGICNGRDVDYFKSLSAKTGVHIVACTGFVGGDSALPFFARASVEYMTRQFIHEITVGIGDTGSRAGVIKVGVSRGGRMTDLDKRIYRAAARAAVTTGVPIMTHLAFDAETADRDLPRGGAPARPRALRARRRQRQRGQGARHMDRRPGRPPGLRHLGLRHRARGPAVLGTPPQGAARALPPGHRAGATWIASCCRPTPTAARSAGPA